MLCNRNYMQCRFLGPSIEAIRKAHYISFFDVVLHHDYINILIIKNCLSGIPEEGSSLLTSHLFMLNKDRSAIQASESLSCIHVLSGRHVDMGRKMVVEFTEDDKKTK